MTEAAIENAIEISSSEVAPCRMKVEFRVPQSAVRTACETAGRSFRGMARVPGFRVGKAPEALVRARYGKEIRQESLRVIHSGCFGKLEKEKTFDIASSPTGGDPEGLAFDPAKEYSFSVEFDIMPEIVLPEYKGITVEAPQFSVSDEMIGETLNYYRNSFGQYESTDAPAAAGDMVRVSYTSDFVAEEGASDLVLRLAASEDRLVWLSEPELLPGIVAALTGAVVGQEVSFLADFPADYSEAAFSGRSVRYAIKVLEVRRKEPLLDDQKLLERMQSPSMDSLRAGIRAEMEREAGNRAEGERRNRLMAKLVSIVPEFPLPKSFLDAERIAQMRRMVRNMVRTEADSEKFKADMKEHEKVAEEMAIRRLRAFFIARKIAEIENIHLTEQDMEAQVQSYSRAYSVPVKKFREYIEQSGEEEEMRIGMLIEKVADFLCKVAIFTPLPSDPSDAPPVQEGNATPA
jgi:trigger factor